MYININTHTISQSGQIKAIKTGSCGFLCDIPHHCKAQRQVCPFLYTVMGRVVMPCVCIL